jgi:hypothetical protein
VVQLVAGAGHFDTRDLSAVAWRCGIDVQHSKGVVGGRVGIEQRHVGKVSAGACMAIVGDG